MAKLPQTLNTLVPTPWRGDMPMMFGKYKGMTVEHVMEEDPRYLVWAHNEVKFFALTDELYREALGKAVKQNRDRAAARADAVLARVGLDRSLGLMSPVDLEREIRQMMSGTFGVHMNDLDLFIENREFNHLDDPDDWTYARPY